MRDATPEEEQALKALKTPEGHTFDDPAAVGYTAHRLQIEDVLAAIQEDREPRVPGAKARKAIEIIRAIYLSSQRDEVIRLPLVDPDA